MSDRPGRKKQPFLFWFPPWRVPSQAPKQQPKHPSLPSQLPPLPSPSSPQLDDDRTRLPSPLPSPQIPSSSSSERREVLPQAESPRAHVDSQELVDELGKSDAKFTSSSSSSEFEAKQAAETETCGVEPALAQLTEEIKPGADIEPQKHSEDQMEHIQQEKSELDSEAQHLQQEKSPIKTADTEEIAKESCSKEVVTSEDEVIKEPKMSIKVSDLISPGGATQQETPEESTNDSLKESKRHKFTKNPGQPKMPKEHNDGLSRLVQKLSIGHKNKFSNEQGMSVITLASENQGASMFIGEEIHQEKNNKTREENHHNVKGNQPIVVSINSNVQGINSSILNETNYCERNPGVHMTISAKPIAHLNITRTTESQKTSSNLSSSQKLTYEPNIKRRCLRALFLDSSEDDLKNPQKPRRHGCRFACDDKTKGKVDDSRKT